MTAPTPLAVTVTFPRAELVNGVYRLVGAPESGPGSINIDPGTTGTGDLSIRVKKQPPWNKIVFAQNPDSGNDWTLVGDTLLPSIRGMVGEVVLEVSDSKTPTPAKVEVKLELIAEIEQGKTMYRGFSHVPVVVTDADWPVVIDEPVTGGTGGLIFTYHLLVRRHADGRLLVRMRDTGHRETFVVPPNWSKGLLCGGLEYFHQQCDGAFLEAVNLMTRVLPPYAP